MQIATLQSIAQPNRKMFTVEGFYSVRKMVHTTLRWSKEIVRIKVGLIFSLIGFFRQMYVVKAYHSLLIFLYIYFELIYYNLSIFSAQITCLFRSPFLYTERAAFVRVWTCGNTLLFGNLTDLTCSKLRLPHQGFKVHSNFFNVFFIYVYLLPLGCRRKLFLLEIF